VLQADLIGCTPYGFFFADLALPDWLTTTEIGELAVQFGSIDGLSEYIDGPNCNPSTPDNFYIGMVPLPGTTSLVSSPNGCNGSLTSNFGKKTILFFF